MEQFKTYSKFHPAPAGQGMSRLMSLWALFFEEMLCAPSKVIAVAANRIVAVVQDTDGAKKAPLLLAILGIFAVVVVPIYFLIETIVLRIVLIVVGLWAVLRGQFSYRRIGK